MPASPKKGSAFQSIRIFSCHADNIPRLSDQKDKCPLRSFGMSHAPDAPTGNPILTNSRPRIGNELSSRSRSCPRAGRSP